MRAALIAAAAVLLAGCHTMHDAHHESGASPPPHPVAEFPDTAEEATAADTCGAAAFAHLIGTLASDIDQSTLPPRTRIITPDSMVTQDFAPGRLNIFTGTDGRVSSMRCF